MQCDFRGSWPVCLVLWALPLLGQRGSGELRLTVSDPSGLALQATVELDSQATQVRQTFRTDNRGRYTAKPLPFGIYRLRVEREGFTPQSRLIEIRSEVPVQQHVTLGVAPVETTVVVKDSDTLIDPHRTGTMQHVGLEALRESGANAPARAVLEMVNAQPGWLLEANGVLHPRGSEYNTQYVIDGIPITDNRSPAFAPALEIEDLQSMNVFTGNYPAEYGRKLGGVVEVVSARNLRPGFHGTAIVDGGSFAAATSYLSAQYRFGRTTATVAAQAAQTGRFLDPPVEENYTNHASNAGVTARFERDLTGQDSIWLYAHRKHSGFLVPNERIQQAAGQRQDRQSGETMGQFSYQHVVSPVALVQVRGMARDLSAELWSNPSSTPMIAAQDRGFREAYFAASLSANRGPHEFKTGAEMIVTTLREQFGYRVTDAGFFDQDLPGNFDFSGQDRGHEAALFVQDQVRAGNWTFSLGLRWDRYSLLVTENAFSPRLGVAWHLPSAGLVVRASYDRAFETPAMEGLLLAGSERIQHLTPETSGLPLKPSRGNFYQAGFTKSLLGRMRLDAAYFRRDIRNFGDDGVLLNTGVSFPLAFDHAEIHGVEAKLELPRWGPLSGYLSYSNLAGTGFLPLTGGLFVEEDTAGLLRSHDSFPISQDQRNTVRGRLRYEVFSRLWLAAGASYNSGLPIERERDFDREQLAQRFSSRILSEVDLARGRVRPQFALDASLGATLWRHEQRSLNLQADAWNLTGRLNVINFSGLFSGTALAPPRSFAVRLEAQF